MNNKNLLSRINAFNTSILAALPLLAISAAGHTGVLDNIERGESLRNAVSLEARNGDGFTILEMAEALQDAELFNPSLMLLYAAEEHPTKACRYIDEFQLRNLASAVSQATLIALENDSEGSTTLLRCLAKFQPQLASDIYVDVVVELPEQASNVLDIYDSVDHRVALTAYRKGMQIQEGSPHCASLSQLCRSTDEFRFNLAGTPTHGIAGGEAYLQYAVSTQYTDNINRAVNAGDESSLIFEPAFGAKKALGPFAMVLAGDAALAASRTNDAQAYADYAGLVGAEYNNPINGLGISLGGSYKQAHDETGLGRDEDGADTTSLDRWERTAAEFTLSSQVPDSAVGIELALRGDEYSYLNNESDTSFMDRLERVAKFSVNYQLSERTGVNVGTSQKSVSYDEQPTASRDFDEHRHWAAINSSITGALDVMIQAGIIDRNIVELVGEPDRRGFWDVKLDWTPAQQTRLTIISSGDNSQSFDLGTTYLKNYRAGITWHNDWLTAGKWSTDITISGLRSEHIGRATPREDETLSYAIQFNRKLGPKALLSANFTRDDRESNVAINEYLRDTATVTLSTSF